MFNHKELLAEIPISTLDAIYKTVKLKLAEDVLKYDFLVRASNIPGWKVDELRLTKRQEEIQRLNSYKIYLEELMEEEIINEELSEETKEEMAVIDSTPNDNPLPEGSTEPETEQA